MIDGAVPLAIGVLIGSGVYLLLRGRTFPVVLGLVMSSYGVNLFLFASGGLKRGAPPLLGLADQTPADPLPQALVLTAIVIGFGMTAFAIVLAMRSRSDMGNDHVDGSEGNRE